MQRGAKPPVSMNGSDGMLYRYVYQHGKTPGKKYQLCIYIHIGKYLYIFSIYKQSSPLIFLGGVGKLFFLGWILWWVVWSGELFMVGIYLFVCFTAW